GERYIRDMANITGITFADDRSEAPEDVMMAVIDGAEIFIPLDELVDFSAELERLTKEKKKLEGEVARTEKMLSNPGFVNKAPEKKIAEEKEKQAKYKDMLEKVCQRLQMVEEKLK
ncbi:MAG: valine--tRNA ligase, partial [Firmicutes bacterium]|nr:valine--tRNA ligase [Bacillota bacterium]